VAVSLLLGGGPDGLKAAKRANKKAKKARPAQSKKYKKYSKTELTFALQEVAEKTEELRLASGNQYERSMRKIVAEVQLRHAAVPFQTLLDNFKRLLPSLVNLEAAVIISTARWQKRSSSRGHLSSYEKKTLYDWVEFRRQIGASANRTDIRHKVRTTLSLSLSLSLALSLSLSRSLSLSVCVCVGGVSW